MPHTIKRDCLVLLILFYIRSICVKSKVTGVLGFKRRSFEVCLLLFTTWVAITP